MNTPKHKVDNGFDISAMRHDLKNPLTTLQIYLESIEKKIESGDVANLSAYVAKAKTTISDMVKLLDSY